MLTQCSEYSHFNTLYFFMQYFAQVSSLPMNSSAEKTSHVPKITSYHPDIDSDMNLRVVETNAAKQCKTNTVKHYVIGIKQGISDWDLYEPKQKKLIKESRNKNTVQKGNWFYNL